MNLVLRLNMKILSFECRIIRFCLIFALNMFFSYGLTQEMMCSPAISGNCNKPATRNIKEWFVFIMPGDNSPVVLTDIDKPQKYFLI